MSDQDMAMLLFAKLAQLSQTKRQRVGRDKFLILAGAAACRTGYLEVAGRCRELVLANNPAHLLGKSPTFADALRNEAFQTFLKRLQRFCSSEKAEHLLAELDVELRVPEPMTSAQYALRMLSGADWYD